MDGIPALRPVQLRLRLTTNPTKVRTSTTGLLVNQLKSLDSNVEEMKSEIRPFSSSQLHLRRAPCYFSHRRSRLLSQRRRHRPLLGLISLVPLSSLRRCRERTNAIWDLTSCAGLLNLNRYCHTGKWTEAARICWEASCQSEIDHENRPEHVLNSHI